MDFINCAQCPDFKWNVIRLILFGLTFLLYAAIMIKSNLGDAEEPLDFKMHSVYLKILSNYF